jgi:hypothetical protein
MFKAALLGQGSKQKIGESNDMGVNRGLRSMLLWIVALCLTRTVLAHHSTAEFDYTRQVTIKGIVKEVQWTNPHSYIQLIVDGDAGAKVQWSIEIGSPSLNINLGWRKDSVKAGDVITMILSPARSGKPYGTLRVLTFADGRKLDGVAARVGAGPGPGGSPPAASPPAGNP